MFIQLLRAAQPAPRLRRLTSCTSGGAAMPAAVLGEFEKVFGTTIYEGYGLSETSPTATVNHRAFGTWPGTVGHSVWGVSARAARGALAEGAQAGAAQAVRAAALNTAPRPRPSDSHGRLLLATIISFHAPLAQLAEQRTLNPRVRGSSPWRRTRSDLAV